MDTKVKIELRDTGACLPTKAHEGDACFDLYLPQGATVKAGETVLLDLGFGMELEAGWEAQIRGRSGLAKQGLWVHPGTIDYLYRQNVKVLVHNVSPADYTWAAGDRVAQMKISKVWQVELCAGAVAPSARGGFGSSGR